jgi:tRNA(Ile)-lysidine synthase
MVTTRRTTRGAGHGVVQRLSARLAELGLRGSSILIAFSGGRDSTALAVALAEAGRAGSIRARLAHVQHGVRANASNDVPIVLATAEFLRLPISIRAIPLGAIDAHAGCGIEEAMRRERYFLLASMADECDSSAVLTGHHADDQAETVLEHLIRGAGLEGAAGMAPLTKLTIPWWSSTLTGRSLTVVRPLLGEPRSELDKLLSSSGLTVVQDETNWDLERTRAAIRHQAIPILEAIHPDASRALARFANIVRESGHTFSTDETPVGRSPFDLAEFDTASVRLQRARVRDWIREETRMTPTFERTEAIRRWLKRGVGRVEIGDGWSIFREGRTITVHNEGSMRRCDET